MGKLTLKYCPTDDMWADVLTKLIQGTKFCTLCAFLMNCLLDYSEEPSFVPISNSISFSSCNDHIKKLPWSPPALLPMKPRLLQTSASSQGYVETPHQDRVSWLLDLSLYAGNPYMRRRMLCGEIFYFHITTWTLNQHPPLLLTAFNP